MARIAVLSLSRITTVYCLSGAVSPIVYAQDKAPVVAISGELTATPLSRAVAQRVSQLLQQRYSDFRVVPADTIARLLDNGIAYQRGTPLSPVDLREICRQARASAIVDVMMFQEGEVYRGIAFRIVVLRQPSKPWATEIALLPVGGATGTLTNTVAQELVPQIAASLRQAPMESAAAPRARFRCLDFTEGSDTSRYRQPAPSNPGCC